MFVKESASELRVASNKSYVGKLARDELKTMRERRPSSHRSRCGRSWRADRAPQSEVSTEDLVEVVVSAAVAAEHCVVTVFGDPHVPVVLARDVQLADRGEVRERFGERAARSLPEIVGRHAGPGRVEHQTKAAA